MQQIKSMLKDEMLSGYDPGFNAAHFLFEKDCFLKMQQFDGKETGNIITHECTAYNINQRMILTTLQREQGLITKSDIKQVLTYKRANGDIMNPLEWACGCGVPDNSPSMAKYKGFENQIKGACATYRHWFDVFKPETAIELLDKAIKTCIPETAITLALLQYTPHIESLTTTERIFVGFFPDQFK